MEDSCLLPVVIEELPNYGEEHALPRVEGSECESKEERAHKRTTKPRATRAWSSGYPQLKTHAMRQGAKQQVHRKHLQPVGEQAGAQPPPQQPLLNSRDVN